jgi:hypothetical protein
LGVDEDVDAVLVGPHVRALSTALCAYPDPLYGRENGERATGGDHRVELHRAGGRRAAATRCPE